VLKLPREDTTMTREPSRGNDEACVVETIDDGTTICGGPNKGE
jgi:hypothetical protein